MSTVGERVRQLREQRGLSMQVLSEILGFTSYTTISKWESGDNYPRTQEVIAMAKYFNVSSDYLLGLEEERTAPLTKLYYKEEDLINLAILKAYYSNKMVTVTEQEIIRNLLTLEVAEVRNKDKELVSRVEELWANK